VRGENTLAWRWGLVLLVKIKELTSSQSIEKSVAMRVCFHPALRILFNVDYLTLTT
jgi:hypothetical protein